MKNNNYSITGASKQNLLYKDLIKVLRELDIRIKIDTGTFESGFYEVDGDKLFRQHKNTKINKKTQEIIDFLKTIELSNIELPIKIKELLAEEEWKK